jgi:DNA-binding transcriptional MerR regulator
MSERLFIGKVAQAGGLSVQAVRYYERLGLLPPAERTAGGYRAYRPEAVERLRFIRQAQAAGFRLEEIREILRMKFAGQSPCECVRTMLQRKLEEVEEQMAALRRFRKQLRRTLQRARSLPRLPHRASAICPMIESMPTVGNKGGKKR